MSDSISLMRSKLDRCLPTNLTSSTDLTNQTVSICITDGSLALRLIIGLTAHLVKSGFYKPDIGHQLHISNRDSAHCNTYEMSEHPVLQVGDAPEEAIVGEAVIEHLCLTEIRLAFPSLKERRRALSPVGLPIN